VSQNEPATRDELRQLEARIDARFQAVNARFIAVDGRFAETGKHIDNIDHEQQALARRFEARFRSIDNRFDATRTQIDHVRLQISSQIAHTRREVLLGLVLGAAVTAVLCLGTVIVLI
jgi:DNA anti-recombination protein RmuC